jgi:hypothetical protein
LQRIWIFIPKENKKIKKIWNLASIQKLNAPPYQKKKEVECPKININKLELVYIQNLNALSYTGKNEHNFDTR